MNTCSQLTDPYSKGELPTVESTALAMGRSISRIEWHLQQAALLDDRTWASLEADARGLNRSDHLDRATSALAAIFGRAKRLGSNCELIRNQIREIHEQLGSTFWAARDEALEAAIDRAWRLDEVSHEDVVLLAQTCIAPFVVPIEESLLKSFTETGCQWFALGQILDQVVCPPDIARFIRDWQSIRVQRRPMYAKYWEEQLDALTSIELSEEVPNSLPGEEQFLGPASHDCGAVAPRVGWRDELQSKWEEAGLDVRPFEACMERMDQRAIPNADPRVAVVEELFEIAISVAGAGDRLLVDSVKGTVEFDGVQKVVGRTLAIVIDELKSHRSADNALSIPAIRKRHPNIPKYYKLSREVKKLPEGFQKAIKGSSSRGGGHWIEY